MIARFPARARRRMGVSPVRRGITRARAPVAPQSIQWIRAYYVFTTSIVPVFYARAHVGKYRTNVLSRTFGSRYWCLIIFETDFFFFLYPFATHRETAGRYCSRGEKNTIIIRIDHESRSKTVLQCGNVRDENVS